MRCKYPNLCDDAIQEFEKAKNVELPPLVIVSYKNRKNAYLINHLDELKGLNVYISVYDDDYFLSGYNEKNIPDNVKFIFIDHREAENLGERCISMKRYLTHKKLEEMGEKSYIVIDDDVILGSFKCSNYPNKPKTYKIDFRDGLKVCYKYLLEDENAPIGHIAVTNPEVAFFTDFKNKSVTYHRLSGCFIHFCMIDRMKKFGIEWEKKRTFEDCLIIYDTIRKGYHNVYIPWIYCEPSIKCNGRDTTTWYDIATCNTLLMHPQKLFVRKKHQRTICADEKRAKKYPLFVNNTLREKYYKMLQEVLDGKITMNDFYDFTDQYDERFDLKPYDDPFGKNLEDW